MSDVTQGPGWWIASDGKWYPPELHPAARAKAQVDGGAGEAGNDQAVDDRPDHGRWDHSQRSTKGGPKIPDLFQQALNSVASERARSQSTQAGTRR